MRWWPRSELWRCLIASGVVLAIGTGGLIAYWTVDGNRRLRSELQPLRASGAPEFPELIAFAPISAGESPAAWWKAIDAAGEAYSVKDLPACADRLAAHESEGEIEEDFLAALRDPRRVGSLSPCEIAVARQRAEGDGPALELAMQVERFAPYDWHAAFPTAASTFEETLALPCISGYLASIRLLCAHSVLHALEGEFSEARQALSLARRATDLMRDPPSVIAHLARAAALFIWVQEGLLPLLHLLPADTDWKEVDSYLATLDLPAEFQRACIGERAIGNGLYRVMRDSGESRAEFQPNGWGSALFLRTFLARDQATYLELMRKTIATAAERQSVEPWWKLETEVDAAVDARQTLIDGVVWRAILSKLSDNGRWCLGAQARIHLVRAVLIARRDGADAARAWLARMQDPFNAEPLRSRLDPEGILAMWSVGEDRADNPPPAARKRYAPLDDILVEVHVQ